MEMNVKINRKEKARVKFINKVLREVGKAIKRERRKRGMSQQDLALEANISLSYLAKMESGKVNPSVKQLRKIVRVFRLKLSKLLVEADLVPVYE